MYFFDYISHNDISINNKFKNKKQIIKYRYFILLLIALISFSVNAQTCGDPNATAIKNANDCYVTGGRIKGNYLKSIDYANQVLSKSPKNSRANAFIAFSYMRMEKHAEALPYFRKAIETGSNTYDVYGLYGMSLEALGNTDEAIKWYRQSLIISPELHDVTSRLANLLVISNKKDEAIDLLEKFDATRLKKGKSQRFQGQIMIIKENIKKEDKTLQPIAKQTPSARLEILQNLFKKGLISKEEYENKRAQIISEM